jgi:hypothetical protein
MAFPSLANSFGKAIPPLGAGQGFPGHPSRIADSIIEARVVLATSANPLSFGSPVVGIASATGGSWQSVSDYLAANAANAQNLQALFSGVCVWNFKTQQPYSALSQTPVTQVNTTATQATVGATTIVVASATGIVLGQGVTGFGIQANTTVTGISGTTITISLATTGVLSTTPVVFTNVNVVATGSFAQGTMGEVLVRSSITVPINAGTPQAFNPVYIRTVANAATPNTYVGDFEATQELATSSLTYGCTIGSTTFTTSAGTGLAIGQQVTGPAIPNNTYIVSGATTSWVFSNPATATIASGAALNAYNVALLGSPSDPWLKFHSGPIDGFNMSEITILSRHV